MFPASMREHILVVDDSPTIRRVVCSILEDAEFECQFTKEFVQLAAGYKTLFDDMGKVKSSWSRPPSSA